MEDNVYLTGRGVLKLTCTREFAGLLDKLIMTIVQV